MKRKFSIALVVLLAVVSVGYVACAGMQEVNQTASWRYKMTVTVETPEGLKSGSAVRQMGNELHSSPLSQNGNPADVSGEAVVIDLGDRGVLFALISSDSDLEFYNAFPVPGKSVGNGGSTPEGIKYYANLPAGTKAAANSSYPPGYPKLVMFKDINDPKSVILVQTWESDAQGYMQLKNDRMGELLGKGVRLKAIDMEVTQESVTWGIVDKYLPKKYEEIVIKNWRMIDKSDRQRLVDLTTFKQGHEK